ncbi:Transposase family Tnp2 protein [Ceratobasidium sp. AG-Ba]|nr:Transposase family Tnp2 protein [Ceratobasidium sp. AG-Ba]
MVPNRPIGPNERWCFCCGDILHVRTVSRHLRDMLLELEAELSDGEADVADQNDHHPAPNVPANPVDAGPHIGQAAGDHDDDDDDIYNDVPMDNIPEAPPPLPPAPERSPAPIPQILPGQLLDNDPEPVPNEEPLLYELDAFGDLAIEPGIADDDPDGPGEDPPFVEEPAHERPELDPAREHLMGDNEVRALLGAQLGDLADEELLELYRGILTERDKRTFLFLSTRLRTHFSRQTYDDLRFGVCEPLDLPSEFIAWRRLHILSGLEARPYDCCVNSCLCYLGKHQHIRICPYCKEPWYNAAGKARRSFSYTPLIPQLQALFRSTDMTEKLKYRAMCDIEAEEDRAQGKPEIIQDVFDGEIYNTLRRTPLDGAYHFFDNPEDLALSLSTDGFTLFKRKRRGLSTAWPIILINYNLHPRYRTRLENVICVGVIPGPTQCKDMNSFLAPVIEELVLLERGVVSLKGSDDFARPAQFVLRAFLIMLFGDIPAVSKLLAIKGHNAIRPCQACYIHAVWCDHNSTYYVPLTPPGVEQGLPAQFLPMRHHALFLQHYEELEALEGQKGRYADLAKDFISKHVFCFTML